MKRATAAILFVLTVILCAGASPAAADSIASYCSPSGDYCQGIFNLENGRRARLSTFSFQGRYRLCVRSRRYGKECRQFRLRRADHGIWQSSVRLASRFRMRWNGTYTVIWHYQGSLLGERLQFRKG